MVDEKITNDMKMINPDPGSFRDPSSQVLVNEDMVVRCISRTYFPEYNQLMSSGLYRELTEDGLLIPHHEGKNDGKNMYIYPERVPFISYPYEWNFLQLKEAALTTLKINDIAKKYDMTLKDASAYNIQVFRGRMCLIDTCSFQRLEPQRPWWAYPQFLRHFACPLILMKYEVPAYVKPLQMSFTDGIPVPYTAKRLPKRALFNLGIWAHIKAQSLNFTVNPNRRKPKMNAMALHSLLGNLRKWIQGIQYTPKIKGTWIDYADAGSYTPAGKKSKNASIRKFIHYVPGRKFLDLGANTGEYSLLAHGMGKNVISVDSSHDCCYRLSEQIQLLPSSAAENIFPLMVDACNPSPGIGWGHNERSSFWSRVGDQDCILALAFIHHLCIKENVPLDMIARLLSEHAKALIIEWVPPGDRQAQKLFGMKTQIPEYNHNVFLQAFSEYFNIIEWDPVLESGRMIFFMERI